MSVFQLLQRIFSHLLNSSCFPANPVSPRPLDDFKDCEWRIEFANFVPTWRHEIWREPRCDLKTTKFSVFQFWPEWCMWDFLIAGPCLAFFINCRPSGKRANTPAHTDGCFSYVTSNLENFSDAHSSKKQIGPMWTAAVSTSATVWPL